MTSRLTRRDALKMAGGAAVAAVAGCVGGGSDKPPEDAGKLGVPAEEYTVTTTSRPFPKFDPQVVHVSPGTTVEWVVETGRHDVTSYHEDNHPPHRTTPQAAAWGSDLMTGPGSSYEHTFETEGVYDYVDTQQVCVSHEIAGNVGRVVVGWPDPTEEPALADPQPDLPSQVANALAQFNEQTRPVLEDGPE